MVDPALSPCIKICKLDDQENCVGCGRHSKEIRLWPWATPEERAEILEAAAVRLKEME
jgi:predicted Fe-S protein YdhL (DUF1289 family)